MMFTYKGGKRVGKGTYWDIMNGQRVEVQRYEILPGDEKATYIKAPSALVLLFGPVLGLIYAMFLPFIGIAMALSLAAKKIGGGMSNAAARSMSFGWRPIEAYLTGKRKERKREREKEKGETDTPK